MTHLSKVVALGMAGAAVLAVGCTSEIRSGDVTAIREFVDPSELPADIWSGDQPKIEDGGLEADIEACSWNGEDLSATVSIGKAPKPGVDVYALLALDAGEKGEFVTSFLRLPASTTQWSTFSIDTSDLRGEHLNHYREFIRPKITVDSPTECSFHVLGSEPLITVQQPVLTKRL